MKNTLFSFFVFSLFYLIVLPGYGQGTKQDTVFLSSSIENTRALFEKSIGVQSNLYNGVHAKRYNYDIAELLPFYFPDWENGSVQYDHELYSNVPLLYDLVLDKVIVSQILTAAEIELITIKTDWFTLRDHTFIHLRQDPLVKYIDDGFYELLYDGNIRLYAKKKKIIKEHIEGLKIEHEISAVDRYFIYKEGHYTPVKKLSSVLAVLSDKDKELKSYSKQSKLNFKKRTEASLKQIVRFYDLGIK